MTQRMQEIQGELEQVLFKRANLLDSLLPPILFLIIFSLVGFTYAVASALAVAVLLGLLRALRGQPLWYALGGAAGVGLAILLTRWLGSEEGFFLPGLLSSIITLLLCFFSLVVRRPLVAWTIFIARRWPLHWYWHPKVRPAYSEVTLFWTLYFGLRFLLQLDLFRQAATGGLALFNLILGWPATVILLVLSYLYGTWRLKRLGGPSVEEFRMSKEPPWESQTRGF
jgi:hypothetical protein